MRPFYSAWLEPDVQRRWLEFADRVPWAHYAADPRWAEIERSGSRVTARRPFFFWAESDGEICLTALGVRRRLPIPGFAFWEFNKGPTFLDQDVFDEWLAWLVPTLRRDAARLRVGPPVPLDRGGDDVETMLERHGFVRRRTFGTWGTLLVDLARDQDEILASFRRQTRQGIRKCEKLGVTVTPEDNPTGWAILHELQTAMSAGAPVSQVSRETLASISRSWLLGGSGGTVLVAREEGLPLAAALVLVYREGAYLRLLPSARQDGATSGAPVSHLLVWEAMRWARDRRCTVFDLEGYSLVARPGDPLWGVNQFKRGFAPDQEPLRVVAMHEKVSLPLIDASARVFRRTQRAKRRPARDART